MATSKTGSEPSEQEGDAESEESPDIDEDLIQEELRIDGICGVY